MPIPNQRVRVVGSGFTVFHWQQQVIAFAKNVSVQAVTPVAQHEVIQPLNAQRPLEIITAGAHGAGQLTLTLTELYNKKVWQRLSGLTNCLDIIDIMRTIAENGDGVKITKTVTPPAGIGNGKYTETYNDCVVVAVQDDESVGIESMSVDKVLTIVYTYSTRSGEQRKYPLTGLN
jgi:hypothetical protein